MRTGQGVLFSIIVLVALLAVQLAAAEQNFFGLDTANSYDIYISNETGAGLSVIRNVTILESRQISGEVFILIRSDSFASRLNEGLVRFSAIQAVLPSKRSFKIDGTTKFLP